MIHKLLKRPQAIIGLCLIAIVIVIAIAAPAFSPHDPELVNLSQKYAQPDAEYPLGTDQLGRCTLSRLLYGARYSIGISLPVLLILSVIGLIVGTFSACAGEKADHFITILCDVFIAFPSLIIAIAVIGVLGNGLQNIAVSVVIATWAWFVRVVRSYSVQEMGKDYILAARISGCNTGKLVFRHLIPNILPQFLVYVSTGVASSIIMVSSFAFLGLGLPSGTPEWGAMLNDARTALYSHPELLIYPGLCIFVTAAGFNLFGEALRDILMPEEDSLLVPPDIEALCVRFAGIVEGIQIRHTGCRENTLELLAEGVVSHGAGTAEALLLTEQEPVHIELAPHQLRQHIGLEQLERVIIRSGQLDIDGTVEQRLSVAVHGSYQRRHILQIAFRRDRLLQVVGVGAAHAVFVGGILDDALFLGRCYLPGVDTQRDSILFTEMAKDGLLIGLGGVLAQRPDAAECVAADEVVRFELDHGRRDHIQKGFDSCSLPALRRCFFRFLCQMSPSFTHRQ